MDKEQTVVIETKPFLMTDTRQAEDRMHRVGKIIPTGNAPAIVECQTLQEVFEILEYKQKRLA
jgi:hypothetical protein